MNLDITPEEQTEFKELLADIAKETTIIPQSYKYKFETSSKDTESFKFYQQENLKLKNESSCRPVSATKSPAPSVSVSLNYKSPPCLTEELISKCLISSTKSSTSGPLNENTKTRTVLKHKRQS